MTFDLTYALTPTLLTAYQRAAQSRLLRAASTSIGWRGEALNVAVATLFAGVIWAALEALSRWTGSPADYASAFVGFLAGCAMVFAALWHRAFEVRRLLTQPTIPSLLFYRVVVDSEQLQFTHPRADTVLRWPFVQDITQKQDMFILWIEPGAGFIIPRSAFADDASVRAFLDFARERIVRSA